MCILLSQNTSMEWSLVYQILKNIKILLDENSLLKKTIINCFNTFILVDGCSAI